MGAKEKLTEQQRKFCLEYRKNGGNATEAAKAVGYSEKSAYKQGSLLLQKISVLNYIDKLVKDSERQSIMGLVERQETLTKIARNNKAKDADRNKAIDILNKMDGVYVINVNLTMNDSVKDTLFSRRNKRGK